MRQVVADLWEQELTPWPLMAHLEPSLSCDCVWSLLDEQPVEWPELHPEVLKKSSESTLELPEKRVSSSEQPIETPLEPKKLLAWLPQQR